MEIWRWFKLEGLISFVIVVGLKVLTELQSSMVILGEDRGENAVASLQAVAATKKKAFIVYGGCKGDENESYLAVEGWYRA